MEQAILEAEARVEALEKEAADPSVIADHARHAEACRKLGSAHDLVRRLYDRWAQLEDMQQG